MEGLGEKIKDLRQKKGLTIRELMVKTGIDKATLSRIENGKMPGTVNTHLKIAEALGVRLPDLYEDVLARQQVQEEKITRARVETFSHTSGAIAELLTTGVLQKKMMPVLLKIQPQGHTETEEFPVGTERFIYVMKGAVRLTTEGGTTSLKKGESFYFNGARPHAFENRTRSEAVCLSVITPVSL